MRHSIKWYSQNSLLPEVVVVCLLCILIGVFGYPIWLIVLTELFVVVAARRAWVAINRRQR